MSVKRKVTVPLGSSPTRLTIDLAVRIRTPVSSPADGVYSTE
jgi:hypothetical protein